MLAVPTRQQLAHLARRIPRHLPLPPPRPQPHTRRTCHPLDFAVRLAGRVPARCWRGPPYPICIRAIVVSAPFGIVLYDRLCLAL